MGFRFRRSARLGPLRFHFSKAGLSSISVGGRGASFNLPVARSGGARSTVGLTGTGLSWTAEHEPGPAAGLPNSRRLRPGQLDAFRSSVHAVLVEQLFTPGSSAVQLWELGLVSRLLSDGSIGARQAGQLAPIETPEALGGYLLRAQSQDETKRRGPADPDAGSCAPTNSRSVSSTVRGDTSRLIAAAARCNRGSVARRTTRSVDCLPCSTAHHQCREFTIGPMPGVMKRSISWRAES